MNKVESIDFKLKLNANNEDFCTALCNRLNNSNVRFENIFQIFTEKNNTCTLVKIDYLKELYSPKCKYGYDDCISDPAYIKYFYNKDKDNCSHCIDGDWYDNENL